MSREMNIPNREYARWLVNDQCRTLLNMDYQQIADVIGTSRPTVYNRMKDYGSFTIEELERVEYHLQFVKAALLTTETRQKGDL